MRKSRFSFSVNHMDFPIASMIVNEKE